VPAHSWRTPLDGLPLSAPTITGWARTALLDLDALLVDHAHCEHKAASTALRLINRFPDHQPLLRPMLALAGEEMLHFRQVLDLLEARGVVLTRPEPDRYVNLLRRRCTSDGRGLGALGDHLLIAAFVEARSCERLRLLAEELSSRPDDDQRALAGFYGRLATAEGRHWELFHQLAAGSAPPPRLRRRVAEIAAMEAEILGSLPAAPRMH
jgi:tRNA-(ms[2]io[6]A)-hydroxylase